MFHGAGNKKDTSHENDDEGGSSHHGVLCCEEDTDGDGDGESHLGSDGFGVEQETLSTAAIVKGIVGSLGRRSEGTRVGLPVLGSNSKEISVFGGRKIDTGDNTANAEFDTVVDGVLAKSDAEFVGNDCACIFGEERGADFRVDFRFSSQDFIAVNDGQVLDAVGLTLSIELLEYFLFFFGESENERTVAREAEVEFAIELREHDATLRAVFGAVRAGLVVEAGVHDS